MPVKPLKPTLPLITYCPSSLLTFRCKSCNFPFVTTRSLRNGTKLIIPAVSISSACTNTSKLDTSSISILPFTRIDEPSTSAVKAPLDIPLILRATVPSRFSTLRLTPSLARSATWPLLMVISPLKLPDLFGSDGLTNFSILQVPSFNCHI